MRTITVRFIGDFISKILLGNNKNIILNAKQKNPHNLIRSRVVLNKNHPKPQGFCHLQQFFAFTNLKFSFTNNRSSYFILKCKPTYFLK